MDFEIDQRTGEALAAIRHRGRTEVRPVGLEADRLGRPVPVDDPYFARLIERGEGRTRWRGSEGEKKASSKERKSAPRVRRRTVMSLLYVEELA